MLPPKCRLGPEGAGCGRVSTDGVLLPQLFFSYTPQTAPLKTLILNLRMCSAHKCKDQLSSLRWENVKGIISRSTMSLPSAFHRLFFKIDLENCLKEWKPFRLPSWLAFWPPTSILQYPCFYQLTCLQISLIKSREKMLNLGTMSASPQMVRGWGIYLPTQETREMWVDPWVGKIPWRRKWQPTPVFLPGESHGQRSLAGYGPWGQRVRRNRAHAHIWTM